ncbi:MAG TPA: SDR family NAD(P)-dependent oxidoreductase [Candidatus Aquabacterium excrementipullorum]|nr:SDR family NAD(P)-dependent oxidoreductase [Candidatus Aquabacterium excrementipullorum]
MAANKGMRLAGARILVTGASSGIGRATTIAMARQGASLVLVARREQTLQALADTIASQGNVRPLVLAADLAQRGVASEVAAQAEQAWGGIDILVNNAGMSLIGAQHLTGDDERARALFEANYWSPLALIQALAPGMRQRGLGCLVNVTSTLQAVPVPLLGCYSASKVALARATQALRHELQGAGVRVMEVIPGGTDTPTRHQDKMLPLRRKLPAMPLVSPESTAEAIMRGIVKGSQRVVHPASSWLPLELPAIGRGISHLAARIIDARSEQVIAGS